MLVFVIVKQNLHLTMQLRNYKLCDIYAKRSILGFFSRKYEMRSHHIFRFVPVYVDAAAFVLLFSETVQEFVYLFLHDIGHPPHLA